MYLASPCFCCTTTCWAPYPLLFRSPSPTTADRYVQPILECLALVARRDCASGPIGHLLHKTIPDKEFEIMIIKMLTKIERRMNEHSQTFNKEKI